jgi:hypothetical protein
VADLRQGGLPGWLEAELTRQFHPVSAPDSLWDRIHEQRRPLRARPNPWKTRSIAAAALLALLAGLVWRLGATRDPAAELEALAQRELRGASNVDLRSGDLRSDNPRKIQVWVKANSGIDIRLPDRREFGNNVVRLVGARLLSVRNAPVAVIGYQVGDTSAALVVTSVSHRDRHADSGGIAGPGHVAFRNEAATGARLYSWGAGANEYALAFGSAKDPGRPCLLCHAATPALMILR